MQLTEESIERELKHLMKLKKEFRKDKGEKRLTYNFSKNKQYIQYLKRSNVKGFEFELTEKHFENISDMTCNYCGDSATGYDRVDSKIGYTIANIVPCCQSCNMMKNAVAVKNFIQKIKQIHDYLNL